MAITLQESLRGIFYAPFYAALAHDAYAKVLPALREKTVGQPQAFLYTTARHLALDRLKRRARAPFHPSQTADDATALSSSPGVEAIVMAREEWTLMERAVAELPPSCRQVLLLRTPPARHAPASRLDQRKRLRQKRRRPAAARTDRHRRRLKTFFR